MNQEKQMHVRWHHLLTGKDEYLFAVFCPVSPMDAPPPINPSDLSQKHPRLSFARQTIPLGCDVTGGTCCFRQWRVGFLGHRN
ncbi:hypothetical protein CEXT_237151 [Caerostris extrusa]|uniref:Uncharacterized protein n=1 Tax=Caerostris extrusa TaxID=172846 RepID=A0AAV4U145_CAEEX|nr:hypothetical protein CEXT_237151 [Caerostris extrusa]